MSAALPPPRANPTRLAGLLRLVAIVLVALVILSVPLGSFYTVDQKQRVVLLTNGAYSATTGPGLHFKIPWVQSAVPISVETHTFKYGKVNSYSSDQQPADVDLSVTLAVDPARVADIYAHFGSVDNAVARIVTPAVSQEFKVVFGRYTAASAIQDRAKLNADAFQAIQAAVAGYPELQLKGVQVENIDFSQQYISSIEARMQAEIEVQKIQQNAQREKVQAEITVIQAKAKADAVVAQAEAEANATKLRGEAEAAAIRAKGDALKDNPGLVALTQAERWNGVLPTTMVPGGATPMLNLQAGR
jgi:regulator of protease activity HflC (stomatin/prohibitin superfamily)